MSATASSVSISGSATSLTSAVGGEITAKTAGAIGGAIGGLVLLVFLLVLCLSRKQIKSWLEHHRLRRHATSSSSQRSVREVQQNQPASIPSVVGRYAGQLRNGTSGTGNNARGRGPPRRPFPYMQRQDSGGSIRSIPVYQEQPADEEMVLVRPRPSEDVTRSSIDVSTENESFQPYSEPLSRSTSSSSTDSANPNRTRSSSITTSLLLPQPPEYVYRSRSNSSPLAQESQLSLSLVPTNTSSSMSRSHSGQSSPFAPSHRSTVSLDIPRQPVVEPSGRRKSGFRSRGPSVSNGSNSILPLYRNPKFQNSSSSLASSLVISPPISETFVAGSSNYVYPRAGLSKEQMSFISSRESLIALAGVSPSNNPPAFDDEPPEPIPLPSSSASSRRNSYIHAGSFDTAPASSPLATSSIHADSVTGDQHDRPADTMSITASDTPSIVIMPDSSVDLERLASRLSSSSRETLREESAISPAPRMRHISECSAASSNTVVSAASDRTFVTARAPSAPPAVATAVPAAAPG